MMDNCSLSLLYFSRTERLVLEKNVYSIEIDKKIEKSIVRTHLPIFLMFSVEYLFEFLSLMDDNLFESYLRENFLKCIEIVGVEMCSLSDEDFYDRIEISKRMNLFGMNMKNI